MAISKKDAAKLAEVLVGYEGNNDLARGLIRTIKGVAKTNKSFQKTLKRVDKALIKIALRRTIGKAQKKDKKA